MAAVMLLLAMTVGMSGCKKTQKNDAASQIEKQIKGLTFPQTLKDGSTLTALYYQDGVLTYRMEIDKEKFDRLDTKADREKTINNLRNGLYPRNLTNAIIETDGQIRYIYVNGKDSVAYQITADELK